MGKWQFLKTKLGGIDYKRMNFILNWVAKENNKSPLLVKTKFLGDALKYKIGYTDYMKGNYINLTKEQKQEYLTTRNYYSIVTYLNDRKYWNMIHDKLIFNQLYRQFLGREFIDLRSTSVEQFKQFLKGKEAVFAKRHNWFGGEGVHKIKVKDISDYKSVYEELIKNKQYLIEDAIIQHPELDAINPFAVNNLRIVTILKDGEAHILGCLLRINDGNYDLINCHDLSIGVDEKGILVSHAIDDDGNIFPEHPKTGFKFKGTKLPYMKEAIEMVKKASLVVPEMRLVGWDIGITPTGPVFIEGNHYPGYGGYQYYLLQPKPMGYLFRVKEILGDEFNNIKF